MTGDRSTPRHMVAQVEHVLLRWVYPQRDHLAALAQGGAASAEDVARAVRRITEAAAETLDVERASVWRVRPDGSALECLDLYRRTPGSHDREPTIPRASAPTYFQALDSARVIAAQDAWQDPRTSELAAGYLQPLGIRSMLDAPVFVRGRAIAVICHEHVGDRPRSWEFWEELVASTFADFVASALETESRGRDAAERRAQEQELERQVAARTGELLESERNLQALLDAAPMPLVLTRASDHRVSYANARATALFELAPEQVVGVAAADFWLEERDRQAFLTTVLSQGRVDDMEVRFRSGRGRVFWARLHAQAVRYRGELSLMAGMVDINEQRRAQENLQVIFASSPVALSLSRLSDRVVLEANQRAADLFEVPITEARGRPALDFWADPGDRDRLLGALQTAPRIERFESEMKTRTGRRFWAELSAGIIEFNGEPALLIGTTDISVRRRAEEALRHSESTLRTLLDTVPNPLVVTRLDDGVLMYCNERAATMFELTVQECVGRRAPDFYADPKERLAFVEALRTQGAVNSFSARLKTSSGRSFWVLMNATVFELEGDRVFMVGFAELSAQKELEERLRTLATVDSLTGTFNRRHFFEVAEAEIERGGRYGRRTSLAMFDVDHFKAINDELGHAAGDATLRALAGILRREVRSVDVLGRIGGEEFALLLPETPLRAAEATAERVRRAIAARSFADQGLPPGRQLTVSVGVAEHRARESVGDLLKRADGGLYRAKSAGRDRVVVQG
jgi:diguanylate cyclase (GGDEF)-like protein/PAS domain S-box-containing protein